MSVRLPPPRIAGISRSANRFLSMMCCPHKTHRLQIVRGFFRVRSISAKRTDSKRIHPSKGWPHLSLGSLVNDREGPSGHLLRQSSRGVTERRLIRRRRRRAHRTRQTRPDSRWKRLLRSCRNEANNCRRLLEARPIVSTAAVVPAMVIVIEHAKRESTTIWLSSTQRCISSRWHEVRERTNVASKPRWM